MKPKALKKKSYEAWTYKRWRTLIRQTKYFGFTFTKPPEELKDEMVKVKLIIKELS